MHVQNLPYIGHRFVVLFLSNRLWFSSLGVLDKVDLAEVYNCDSKRNKHKGDNLAISDFVPPVKAVEFKEAVLEQLLPDITESIEREYAAGLYPALGGNLSWGSFHILLDKLCLQN